MNSLQIALTLLGVGHCATACVLSGSARRYILNTLTFATFKVSPTDWNLEI